MTSDLEVLLEKYRNSRSTWRKIQDVIYRPTYKAKHVYYNIKNGIYGLYYWAGFAWGWRSWDYAHGLEALKHHLKALEVAVREGHHESGVEDARDIRVAIELLNRQDGMYYMLQARSIDLRGIKHAQKKEQADWDYMFELMRRRMKHWWD